tara:strand:- start:264 stop:632 length:369 start_codon:yes stop_codon:yes gene_type:complete
MDVFKKDMILKQIASQIKMNEQISGVGVADLYKLKNENDNLRELYEEKKQCHNTIVNLKKDQEIQILRLLHYLEKSLLDANLTNKMVAEAKHEQQILIKKLKAIQGDISNMTQQVKTAIDEI